MKRGIRGIMLIPIASMRAVYFISSLLGGVLHWAFELSWKWGQAWEHSCIALVDSKSIAGRLDTFLEAGDLCPSSRAI